MKRLALLIPLVIAGCTSRQVDPYTGSYVDATHSSLYSLRRGEPVTLRSTQVAFVQDKVRGELMDPASAMFGRIAAGQSQDGTIVVCGFVNAKNAFGGYTGDQVFVAEIRGEEFELRDIDHDPEFLDRGRGLMVGSCRFAGAQL